MNVRQVNAHLVYFSDVKKTLIESNINTKPPQTFFTIKVEMREMRCLEHFYVI
jgi:hypothetical protein